MKIRNNFFCQLAVVLLLLLSYSIIGICSAGVVCVLIRTLLLVLLCVFLTLILHRTRPIRSRVLTALALVGLRIVGYEIISFFVGNLFAGGIFATIFTDVLLIFCWALAYLLLGGSWKSIQENGKSFLGVAIAFAICVVVNIASFLLFSPGSMVSTSVIGVLDYMQSLRMLSNALAIKSVILEAVLVIVLLKANVKNITADNDSTPVD